MFSNGNRRFQCVSCHHAHNNAGLSIVWILGRFLGKNDVFKQEKQKKPTCENLSTALGTPLRNASSIPTNPINIRSFSKPKSIVAFEVFSRGRKAREITRRPFFSMPRTAASAFCKENEPVLPLSSNCLVHRGRIDDGAPWSGGKKVKLISKQIYIYIYTQKQVLILPCTIECNESH